MSDDVLPSTRPYLVRALHQWCSEHGFTPHLVVRVGAGVKVPMEFVRDGQITLNVGHDATQRLTLGNEWIEFKARFGGVVRDVEVPVEQVMAIYARENGQGMAFPVGAAQEGPIVSASDSVTQELGDNPAPPEGPPPRRPALTRVK